MRRSHYGPLKPKDLEYMLDEYCEVGGSTRTKLEELSLKDVAEEFENLKIEVR